MSWSRDYDGQRMGCPVCESVQLVVIETRSHRGATRRRRKCHDCDYKFYTMEIETDRDCTIDADLVDQFNNNIPPLYQNGNGQPQSTEERI